jgi:hypothetical protein
VYLSVPGPFLFGVTTCGISHKNEKDTIMSLIKVATCQLNQWALDFDANLERVKASMREAKAQVHN